MVWDLLFNGLNIRPTMTILESGSSVKAEKSNIELKQLNGLFQITFPCASDFTTKGTSFYSAIGLKVSYVFSSKKITRDSFERFW